MELKDFVTASNRVQFDSYRAGIFYYNVNHKITLETYQFQIPLDDIGNATLFAMDKSVLFMRWIRKSIEDKTFIKL